MPIHKLLVQADRLTALASRSALVVPDADRLKDWIEAHCPTDTSEAELNMLARMLIARGVGSCG